MSLIRNAGLIGILASSILLTGCEQFESAKQSFYVQKRVPPPEPLNQPPEISDPALAVRPWAPSPTYYANDDVIAGPNYTFLCVRELPDSLNAPVEQLLFVANLLYIGPGVFLEPPWKDEVYKSLTTDPSYTLMPPLPPGAEPMPTY
jgi:hypothetical protein